MKTNIALLLSCLSATSLAAAPEEIRQWLESHNAYRAMHGAAPLVWSQALAASAQSFADSCPSGHSTTSYGENLAWISSFKPAERVVKFWYDEEPLYNYKSPGYSFETGHFTQLVWKGTQEIGCGYAKGCVTRLPNVWVCHYSPAGNYSGQFAENVLPKGADNKGGAGDNGSRNPSPWRTEGGREGDAWPMPSFH